jgi:hypothetical protein
MTWVTPPDSIVCPARPVKVMKHPLVTNAGTHKHEARCTRFPRDLALGADFLRRERRQSLTQVRMNLDYRI